MKRIICLLLVIIMGFSLCACDKVVDDEGNERAVRYGRFVLIEEDWDRSMYLVYDKDTKVVYYLQGGSAGFMTPYLIYTGDGMCSAIYEDGAIRPVPFSICINENTLHQFINSAFGSP